MAEIRVLDRQVAELIAAGEVVERPASIVKELCENSIDAGASSVTVEIKRGGVTYLRITDNGGGIPREQVARAFLRHATSKVRQADDLETISTLGFRGEALASVAAMCRVEMLTRVAHESMGIRYAIEGGSEVACEDAGCPVGTTLVVRDVFYNTPARMKFLKKDVTEGNSVAAVIDKLALSHPEVAFRFLRDGEEKLSTPGDGKLHSAIYAVCGREFAAGMIPVDYHTPTGLNLTGYICKPECSRATRTQQSFYINGRYIRSRTCAAALEEAYRHSVMVGKFPYCVLMLEINAAAVDVNVHPAKTEVRFADEKAVFDLVYYGCKNALGGLGNVTEAADRTKRREMINPLTLKVAPLEGGQQHFSSDQYHQASLRQAVQTEQALAPPASKSSVMLNGFTVNDVSASLKRDDSVPQMGRPRPSDDSLWKPRPVPMSQLRQEEPVTLAPQPSVEAAGSAGIGIDTVVLRQVGEIFDTYILLEGDDRMILVDKHAAHERLIFEELKRNADHGDRQLLLTPITVMLDKELYGAAVQSLETYRCLGFLAEDFGDGALLVREAPLELEKEDIAALAEEIAGKLATHSREMTPHVLDDLYHSVACRSAIKAGHKSSPQELQEIVRLVGEDPAIRNCPHGRPVAVSMTRRELEKLFGRV